MSIDIETSDQVTCVTLNRPPLNTLDLDTILDLEKQFRSLPKDKPVILTGSGKAFSAGVDTKAFFGYSADQKKDMILAITRMTAALLSIRTPVVAAINGHALGGGFVLPLCADYRIAVSDDSHKFGLTEAEAGIPFPIGPTAIIKSELPPPSLRLLTLSSKIVSSDYLKTTGIVDELTSTESLLSTAKARAQTLASQPAFSIVKQQIRGGLIADVTALAKSGKDPLVKHLGLS